MASIIKSPAGTWRIRFRYGDWHFYRSLGKISKADATTTKATVEETISLVRKGRIALPDGVDSETAAMFFISGGRASKQPKVAPKPQTLKQVTDEYFREQPEGSKAVGSLLTERIHVGHLHRLLGGAMPLQDMDVAKLQRYVNRRSKEAGRHGQKVQPVTIRKELATFRQVWQFARDRKWVDAEMPILRVKLPKASDKSPFQTWAQIETRIREGGLDETAAAELWRCLFLTEEEIVSLLDHVMENARYPFIHPMFAFAALTGARRSEILRSERVDFNLESKQILIREQKRKKSASGSYRQVPMNLRLEGIMRAWFDQHPGGRYTICSVADQPLTKHGSNYHFRQVLEDSQWVVLQGFHMLRHSFASICAMRGVPDSIIDAWMGHVTAEMRERYRHLYPEQSHAAMANLFSLFLAAPRSES